MTLLTVMNTMADFVYTPSPEQIRKTNLWKLAEKNGIGSIEELYRRADADPEWFWPAVIEDCNIDFFRDFSSLKDESAGMQFTRWFTGGSVNIAYNCIERFRDSDRAALKYESEDGSRRYISYREMDDLTGKLAGSLTSMGISKGDRVGIFMPLNPECVIAFYAIMRVGAVAVPMFSGYGIQAVKSRIEDAGINTMFVTGSYTRKGKSVDMAGIARNSGCSRIIFHNGSPDGEDEYDFYKLLEGGEYTASARTGSEDPALMLYTSGTTGKPKGTVHVHGGVLVNTAKEVRYYFDMRSDDTLYWITDLGWMMGPWAVIGAHALGGSLFVYDGAVNFPSDDRVWDLVSGNGVTLLGLSPTFVRLAKFNGIQRPMEGVRVFASTGEPWDEDAWMWLFSRIGRGRVPIANISGGTDIMGCFLASTPAVPLMPKCLYRGLGMNSSVFDDNGIEVCNTVGHLVARKHCPSMTRGIWGQAKRYLETYWGKYHTVWSQGDWAEMDREGYFFLYGRADEVIKVAGKRVGPNEIEDSAMKVPGVTECAAAGVPDTLKGEGVVIFFTGDKGEQLGEQIRKQVQADLGKSFSPKHVIRLSALPKTKNGKILRRVIRKAFLNQDPGDTSTIDDPDSLDAIREIGMTLQGR